MVFKLVSILISQPFALCYCIVGFLIFLFVGPMAVSTPPVPHTPVTPSARSIASMRLGPPLRHPSSRMRKESVARMSWKVLSAVVKVRLTHTRTI